MLNNIIKFFLDNKLVAWLMLGLFVIWGLVTAPFNFESDWLPRDPVAVDAIPDIGENQQIVFTKWMGRSPQDVEDQITYPLTSSLLGIPGVKSVRSNSMFGFMCECAFYFVCWWFMFDVLCGVVFPCYACFMYMCWFITFSV